MYEAKRVSLAPLEEVLRHTGMEYGSITAIGLPVDMAILVEPMIINNPELIVGGGLQRSKLLLPGKALMDLP